MVSETWTGPSELDAAPAPERSNVAVTGVVLEMFGSLGFAQLAVEVSMTQARTCATVSAANVLVRSQ